MSEKSNDLRNRLLEVQEITPALRDDYRNALTAMLEHRLTPGTRNLLIVLQLLMLVFTAIGIRALILFYPGPLVYGVWVTFTIVCVASVVWIARSIWSGRVLWSSYFPVADAFTVAATIITVLAIAFGQAAPSDPKSIFGALYGFALLAICIAWSLHNRIAAAELATKEHLLRVELRLAEMADRLQK